jgi:hypothetical protein
VVVAVVSSETVCLHLAAVVAEVVVTKQVCFFHLRVEVEMVVVVVVRKQVCYQLIVEVVVEEEVDTQAVWMVNCYSAALALILSVVHFARLWTQMNAKGSKISPELEAEVVHTEEVSCSSRE